VHTCGDEGVTAFVADVATELPTAFVATTVKVYTVPFINPVTFIGEVAPVTGGVTGLDVTVYPVIALPPSFGTVNATLAEAFPAVATTPDGAPGTVVVTHGTPGQFSNAAFFHRTLISSKLNETFRFISDADISLDNNSPLGFSPFEFICAKQITGSNKNVKILNTIFIFF
jgi:hypothetical protein